MGNKVNNKKAKANLVDDQATVPAEDAGGLTDEQIELERQFLEGIPRMNWGAFFMPPIWGPGHGSIITILFYPMWLFADNSFYAAFTQQTALSIVVALVIFAVLLGLTIAYGLLSQPQAAHRAAEKGKTKEQFLREERIWTVVSIVIALVLVGFATYYNLVIRPTL